MPWLILAIVFAVALPIASTQYPRQEAHVLTVVNSKFNGTPVETVAFQEFISKQSCEYALGFVKGITDTTAECMAK
jgi:hypothetical protein